MEEMYGLHQSIDYGEQTTTASLLTGNMVNPVDYQSLITATTGGPYHDRNRDRDRLPMFGLDHHHHHHFFSSSSSSSITPVMMIQEDDINSTIKAKIASHPRYPTLLEAYIDCQKVGAPPEIVSILEEIRRENNNGYKRHMVSTRLGADPELDEFMETYCEILVKYKSDLSRPFDEASAFLNKIELQLSTLCKPSSRTPISDEVAGSSDDDSGNDIDVSELQPRSEERDLKDKLLRKYSGYISSLKHEFSKKKKKGKLPKEARQSLLDWWNMHYKWPYPTEADKIQLAESTGLDQKQINNWFINQRKRHWKPSENMQFAVMDSISAPFFIDD